MISKVNKEKVLWLKITTKCLYFSYITINLGTRYGLTDEAGVWSERTLFALHIFLYLGIIGFLYNLCGVVYDVTNRKMSKTVRWKKITLKPDFPFETRPAELQKNRKRLFFVLRYTCERIRLILSLFEFFPVTFVPYAVTLYARIPDVCNYTRTQRTAFTRVWYTPIDGCIPMVIVIRRVDAVRCGWLGACLY